MMMRGEIRAVVIAVVLGTAATAGADPQPISLAHAREAITTAPKHRSATARRNAAALGVDAAGGWTSTTVGVSTSWKTARLGLAMSTPLPVLGASRQIDADRAIARAERDVAVAETAQTDLELAHDVTKAWLELARAEGHRVAAHDAVTREQALVTATQERMTAGDAAHADVLQVDAVAKRATARERAETAAVGVAGAELAALLGWPADADVAPDGEVPPPPLLAPLAQWRQHASSHAAIRVVTAQRTQASSEIAQASAAKWPVLALDADAGIDDPTLPGTDVRVGFSVALPLFGRAGAKQTAAVARRDAVQVELEATASVLDANIIAAYRRVVAARDRSDAMEHDVLPAARAAADVARESYREGVGGLANVLEAERLLADSELEALDARVDAAQGLRGSRMGGRRVADRRGTMTSRRAWVWGLVVVAAVGCAKKDATDLTPAAGSDEEADAVALDVACQARAPDSAADSVELRGVVAVPPDRDAIVAPAVAGRVREVTVKPGDHVLAGALLATIDAPDVQASAGESDAERATAKAELTAADAALARTQHLVDRGIAPRRDLDDALARRATAVAGVAAATARTTLGQRQRANGRVTAPLAGVVLRVMKRTGELVDGTVSTPLVEIADPAVLELRADVPATEIVRLGGALTAEVTIDAAPERRFAADVTYVSPAIDPATGLGEVRATIHTADVKDVTLALGLAGTLAIHLGAAKPVASVPVSALRRSSTGDEELVVCRTADKGLVADVRPVTTGLRDHGRVAIVTGVNPGELVATEHVLGLHDGAALAAQTP